MIRRISGVGRFDRFIRIFFLSYLIFFCSFEIYFKLLSDQIKRRMKGSSFFQFFVFNFEWREADERARSFVSLIDARSNYFHRFSHTFLFFRSAYL